MLTPSQLDQLPGPILELFEEFEQSIINDIARRLAGMHFSSAAWQVQRLSESGMLYEKILAELAKVTNLSERELSRTFARAGVKAMRFDDDIYRKAGLDPLPLNLSPGMVETLAAGLRKTMGVMRNLTMTTAISGQNAFLSAADLAYMQVSTGAMSYTQAIRAGVRQVAADGLTVIQYGGRVDQLDVAMRRAVLTGVSQTTGELQMRRADELGQDLVQTTAHAGARPTHQVWQGRIFSRSGKSDVYPDFVAETGYGTGPGLMGWNCVVGDTIVSSSPINAIYRREYSGEIIVIHTASDKKLTVTPNHPILTENGWVPAGKLAEGDNVISRSRQDRVNGTSPDIDQSVSSIEDIFNSLSVIGEIFSFPISSRDFHGDVTDHQVDVIFPNGFLGNGGKPASNEHLSEFPFHRASEPSGFLFSLRSFDEIFLGPLHSSNRIMGGRDQSGKFIAGHASDTVAHGLASVGPEGNAQLCKIAPDSTFRDPGLFRNFVFPHPGVVHSQQIIGRDTVSAHDVRAPIFPFIDAVPSKAILNGMDRASIFIGNDAHDYPRIIELDNIVLIERKPAQSPFIHVYNLETEDGWYYANDIITHNCRHHFYPFFEGLSQNAYDAATLDEFESRKVKYNGSQLSFYDATQQQRAIERKIRYWKRQASAMNAAGLDATNESAKIRAWQAQLRSFIKQTGLVRQRSREQIIGT